MERSTKKAVGENPGSLDETYFRSNRLRIFAPVISTGCVPRASRFALRFGAPARASAIHSLANLPVSMSWSDSYMRALTSGVMIRGPLTYSPHSAVLDMTAFIFWMPPS